ncbi:MFS transporter [Streptomyces sp. NPDC127178]|uniref:MFS transporter n=1 Tax=unclassified Streptomyces TaxID=2593676 RepID=UPI003636BD78
MSLKASAQLLRHRPFRLLALGRVISMAGSSVAPVAQAFAVLDLTDSASALGIVLMAGFAPRIAFLLVGGVIADRLPRGPVMVVSNLVSAIGQGATALLLILNTAQLWHIAALAAVTGTASAFFQPASQGILPQVVGPQDLRQANALLRLTTNIVQVLGPALGGLLVALVGSGWGFAWDAVTFAVAALLLSRLKVAHENITTRNFLGELLEGWHEFWSRAWLSSMVVQFAVANAIWVACFQLLGPVAAEADLGGAKAWGVITAALALGLIAGGLVMIWWQPQRPLVAVCWASLAKIAPFAALASTDSTLWIAAATFLAGLGIEVIIVSFGATMQERIPGDRLSRVSSYDILLSTAATPVGYALAGPLSEALGLSTVFWAAAGLMTVAAVAPAAVPSVRQIRRQDYEAEQPPALAKAT